MGSSVSPLTMRASCPSSPSWRGCALLRSKLPTSQVQHCNYHHHLGSLKRLPLSHQYTPAVSSDRDLGVKGRGDTSNIPEKNLILSLQNTKSNVAALLRTRSFYFVIVDVTSWRIYVYKFVITAFV